MPCLPGKKTRLFGKWIWKKSKQNVTQQNIHVSNKPPIAEMLKKRGLIQNFWRASPPLQGCNQTLEHDEASVKLQRCKPLGDSGGMPPTRKFWNLEAQKCSCKHFPWQFFFQKSQSWASVEVFTFLLLSDTGAKLPLHYRMYLYL